MVEFSFDRDEFGPDPDYRREEDRRRDSREQERREQDRLSRDREDARREMEREAAEDALRRVVNDDDITIPDSMIAIINDPDMKMDRDMTIRRRTRRSRSSPFSSQFRRDKLLPSKRTRKKTKTDKNMSKALREANARYRNKNGKLKKGKTQGDVMRLAHRLRRKM
jgi:hypothetical protein